MKFKEFTQKVLENFKNALYPKNLACDVCGKELAHLNRYNLCGECLEKFPLIGDKKICLICGMPLENEADYCIRCMNYKTEFDLNRAALVYKYAAVELVHRLKFGNEKYLAEVLSAYMADAFLRYEMHADVILFVPMSVAERKKRGYSHTEILANELGKRLNLPVTDALKKVKETTTQRGLTAADRQKNLEDAFAALGTVRGKKCLVVDDVFTTGTTMSECAKALYKERAKSVSGLTLSITERKVYGETADKAK